MAVLSRQEQPQTSRLRQQIAFSLLSRTISISAVGLSFSQQKPAQWPFYQREAQWPFYQSSSNRMARPPNFNDNLHFRYSRFFPAQSIHQRPGQALLSKSKPNARFIKAAADDLYISTTNCNFGVIPHNQFISGRAKLFSAKAGPMAVLLTQGPIALEYAATRWPDLQISSPNCIFASIPHNQFISGRA